MKKIKYITVFFILFLSVQLGLAFPGNDENHSQGYEQGNAPDDPGGGGPVGPIDGGLGLLLAGSISYCIISKNKRKVK